MSDQKEDYLARRVNRALFDLGVDFVEVSVKLEDSQSSITLNCQEKSLERLIQALEDVTVEESTKHPVSPDQLTLF